MTLGRTSSNAIKIKTDGGLRVVECACCGPTDFQPCRDCPPVSGNWTFSISGDLVEPFTEEFQSSSIYCPSDNCDQNDFPQDLPPRACVDTWDAYSGTLSDGLYYGVSIRRSASESNVCGWALLFSISGTFYPPEDSFGDPCSIYSGGEFFISGDSPVGSYPINYQVTCYTFNDDFEPIVLILNKTTAVTIS